VQFTKGKPILIDTHSLERYQEGQIWPAYRQFCQHFLAPLALMSRRDVRQSQLLRVYVDGIPLDLASSLLPLRTWLSFSLLTHIHLHARSQGHFAGKAMDTESCDMSHLGFVAQSPGRNPVSGHSSGGQKVPQGARTIRLPATPNRLLSRRSE